MTGAEDMRKTIEVAALRDRVNSMLANSVEESAPGRVALAVLLESVLMETGNYHGFNLLGTEYLPAEEQTSGNVIRPGADETRRRYH